MQRILRIARPVILVAACLIAALYVGGNFLEIDRGSGEGTATPTVVNSVTRLPDFTLTDLHGAPRPISEWAGRIRLINFWATWCAPCLREMPLLQALHQEQGDSGVQIVGVAVDRQADVERFITEAGISYPILVGQQDAMDLSTDLGLESLVLPFSVVVDSGGEVLRMHLGELHPEQLTRIVKTLRELSAGGIQPREAREELAGL